MINSYEKAGSFLAPALQNAFLKDLTNQRLSYDQVPVPKTRRLSPEEEEISIHDLVKIICKMMDYEFEESVNLIDQNFGQDGKFSLSSRKIREEIGWNQSVSLEEGIQEMIIWIEKNWNKISQMPLEYVHLV